MDERMTVPLLNGFKYGRVYPVMSLDEFQWAPLEPHIYPLAGSNIRRESYVPVSGGDRRPPFADWTVSSILFIGAVLGRMREPAIHSLLGSR